MRALVVAALLLAACGGGASPAQGSPAATSAPAGNSTAAPTQAAGASAPAPASEPKFADIVASGKVATYKVAYKITASGPGAPASESGMAMFFKPGKTRLDITGTDEQGQGGALSIYYLESGTFSCTVSGSDKFCFQVPGNAEQGQAAGFDIQQSFRQDPSAFNGTFKENRTIAGQSSLCYVVKGTAAAGFTDGTFCYTSSGVPLLSSWSVQGATWSMEATSFSATVPDSDFVLPATPQKIPGSP